MLKAMRKPRLTLLGSSIKWTESSKRKESSGWNKPGSFDYLFCVAPSMFSAKTCSKSSSMSSSTPSSMPSTVKKTKRKLKGAVGKTNHYLNAFLGSLNLSRVASRQTLPTFVSTMGSWCRWIASYTLCFHLLITAFLVSSSTWKRSK